MSSSNISFHLTNEIVYLESIFIEITGLSKANQIDFCNLTCGSRLTKKRKFNQKQLSKDSLAIKQNFWYFSVNVLMFPSISVCFCKKRYFLQSSYKYWRQHKNQIRRTATFYLFIFFSISGHTPRHTEP